MIVNVYKSILKINVFAMIIDAIMTINIKNSTTKFAINFVAISINFNNFETKIDNFIVNSIKFNNFVLFSFYYMIEDQLFKQILCSKITIYNDFKIRNKFVNIIDNYSNL